MLHFMLAHGFNPDAQDKYGDAPLIPSTRSPEILGILLAHGSKC